MKKSIWNSRFPRYFHLGIMILFIASWTIAQEFDTDVPIGWAIVPGYANSSEGLVTTTGGAGGEVVTATSGSQLASYVSGNEPRIILVQGTLTGSDVNIGSNKTIVGVGSNAEIKGFYLNMNGSENIIIRNLEISGGTDAIAARYTHHLWIDHCYLHNCGDGLIDITRESDRYTVSWCKFSDHHKTMLLNGGSTHRNDEGKLNGTVHHCWYDGSDTRNPRAGFGKIHVFNSLYNNNGYCIGLHSLCRVVAEKNYFVNTSDAIHQMYTSNPNDGEYGSAEAIDNVRINCTGDWNVDGNGFTVGDYYIHSFVLDPANDVQSIVQSKVGPAAEYGDIGLMPTPGQGAVKVTDGTLSWGTGTVSPNSYVVYFGTTSNPLKVATTSETSYNVSLSGNTVYYWRVDQVTSNGTIQGKLWMFSTGSGIVAPEPVTGVTVSPASAIVGIGSTSQLTAHVEPTNASNKNVNWRSSNTSVATVSSSGLVTGIAAGSATITVITADGGYTAACDVTVSTIPVSGVSISPASVSVGTGRTTQLTATLSPSNASNQNVTWSSSNTAIATVSQSGLVTGATEGSTTITVTTHDGGYTAISNVTVAESVLPIPLISLTFDENSGSVVGNTGSAPATFSKTDPPLWSNNVPANGGASSVDFGTSSGNYYVESGAVISGLTGLESFTVTGWVNNRNSTVGSGGNRIVSWINNGGNGVDIVYNSNGSLTVGINEWPDKSNAISSSGKITTDANAPASNWRFFAVSYNASSGSLSFYFGDNATAASLDNTISYNQGTVGTNIGKLAIGHFNEESKRSSRTNRMFRGLIDQMAIYNSVLSLQDIQTVQNTVSITVPVTGIIVAPASILLDVDETARLTATVSPLNATNQNVSWSSSNTSVATVSPSGLVTAVAEGTATITATTVDGGYSASCDVAVSAIVVPVTGVSLSPTSVSVNINGTAQLTASIEPSDATNQNVTWSSSNTAIATVSQSGLVSGVAEGSTTITVTTHDGGYTAISNVTVAESVLPIPLISLAFDENSGSVVGNTGSAPATFSKTNPPLWSTNVPANGGASSVDFGTSSGNYYVESDAIISGLTGLESFTVTGWVNNRNSTVGSGGNRIVSWIKNGGNGVDIVYNSNGSLTVGINEWPDKSHAISSSGKITTNADAPASNWRFFAVTYNASSGSLSFYFGDNATAASLDNTISYNQGTVGANIGKLAIGHFNEESRRSSRKNRMFRGLIDQVGIYNSVLSLQDIQAVQNTGGTTVSGVGFTAVPTSSAPVKICPLGNSITQANSSHVSYRYPLWKKLVDAGISFDLVGTMNTNKGGSPSWPDYNGLSFDQDHEGHWGWRANQVRDEIQGWLSGYTPDMVLIHIGTNDCYHDKQNASGIISEITQIIEYLRADNPNVVIFLANLIPCRNVQSYIDALNAEIPGCAQGLNTLASPVIFVDMASVVTSGDLYDGIHPGPTGEEKMAQKWFDAINAYLSGTFPVTGVSVNPASVSVGISATTQLSASGSKNTVNSMEMDNNSTELTAKFYPNPINDRLIIMFNKELTEEVEIRLMDIRGGLIQTDIANGNMHQLNVDGLKSGMYIVRITGTNVNLVKTIAKE